MLVIFFSCVILLILNLVGYSFWYGITPTPTSFTVQKALISLLPETITGEIVELGSGWGTLAIGLANRYPNVTVIGYEISFIPYLVSKVLLAIKRCSNLQFIRKDFFSIDLNRAQLVVCYLYPEAMERLKKKFKKELKIGTYIVSHTFAIAGWQPIYMKKACDLYHTPVYIYQIT